MAVGALSVCVALPCAAENLKGFWGRGEATNWKAAPKANSSSQIEYRDYPLSIDQVKQLQAEEQAVEDQVKAQLDGKAEDAVPDIHDSVETKGNADTNKILTRDQIIAEYGAPDENRPIQAQKDAPLEMKGLIAAMNSGDKELAFKYAVALARRDTETQKVVSKVADYRLLAAEALGLRAGQAAEADKEISPTRLEVRDYMEKVRREEQQKKLDLEKSLQNAEQMGAEDSWQVKAGSTGQGVVEEEIPVDPGGKVRLLVFFDEKDPNIKEVTAPLRQLLAKFKNDTDISLLGLTRRSYVNQGLKQVAASTSFPLPILNGEALALDLRIHRYPSFVFVAPTSKEKYRLDGLRTPEELEKVIRLMKGGR
jgi:hypothetical protein